MEQSINWGMLFIAFAGYAVAGTLHHFKVHVRFGRFSGVVVRGERGPGEGQMRELYERFIAVIIMVATAALVLALSGILTGVWGWVSKGPHVLLLMGAALVETIWFYHLIVRGNGHHPVRANVVGALTGITFTLIWGGWQYVGPAARAAISAASKTAKNAANGKAVQLPTTAKSAEHSAKSLLHGGANASQLGTVVLIAGLVVLLALLARTYRGARACRPRKNRNRGRGQLTAGNGGRRGSGAPAGVPMGIPGGGWDPGAYGDQ